MRRQNNLITLFSAMFAFFFGCFLTSTFTSIENSTKSSSIHSAVFTANKETNENFLVILILSAPANFERRQVIRESWLQFAKKSLIQPYFPEDFVYIPEYDENQFLETESVAEQSNRLRIFEDWQTNIENTIATKRNFRIKTFFSIGTRNLSPSLLSELDREQTINQDLLLLKDLHDSYANLTKKLLRSFEVIEKISFDYILKVDDDTYVKLDFLLNELVSYDRKLLRRSKEYQGDLLPELYWGYFNGNANIKTKGQWRETKYSLCSRYLPYALGGGYVISANIAEYINLNSRFLNTYVSEDVSMGTWLATLKNIHRKHDVRFDTAWMPRKCKKYHIVLHKRTIDQMKDLYEGKLCSFETEKLMKRPPEYYYNWNKLSDNCCNSLT